MNLPNPYEDPLSNLAGCESGTGVPGAAFDCVHARAHLDEFIDHQIAAEQQRIVEAHLANCPGCHDEFGLEELVKHLVARSCLDRAPETLRTKVVAELIAIRVQVYRSGG